MQMLEYYFFFGMLSVITTFGLLARPLSPPGPLFTKKTPSYGYRNPHDKPKTVWWLSQVYNRNPYTDKTASSSGGHWVQLSGPSWQWSMALLIISCWRKGVKAMKMSACVWFLKVMVLLHHPSLRLGQSWCSQVLLWCSPVWHDTAYIHHCSYWRWIYKSECEPTKDIHTSP